MFFLINKLDMGEEIYLCMTLTSFPSTILVKTRFEPTTLVSWVKFATRQTGLTPRIILEFLLNLNCF